MGIPNPFVFAISALRTWLGPVFQYLFMTGASINGMLGPNWQPVQLVTNGALPANTYNGTTLKKTATSTGALTVDGVAVKAGYRIWDKNAATGSQRGLFVVLNPGNAAQNGQPASAWVLQRATDANTSGEYVQNKVFAVELGAVNENKLFQFVTSPFTLDTTTPVITDITGVAVATGSGDMVLASVQTVTGAKTYQAGTLKADNSGNTFATTIASAATAARTSTLPDGTGTLLDDATAQTVSGAKKFLATLLGVWNSGVTFATSFATNATADRTVTFPDLGGHVMLAESADNISGTKTFQAGKALINNAGNTFATTLASDATASRTATLPDATGIVSTSGNWAPMAFTGAAAPGPVAAVGVKVGGKVVQLYDIAGGISDARANFEATITVDDQIQQTGGGDLSMDQFFGTVINP